MIRWTFLRRLKHGSGGDVGQYVADDEDGGKDRGEGYGVDCDICDSSDDHPGISPKASYTVFGKVASNEISIFS
jgi:hypothetical protein